MSIVVNVNGESINYPQTGDTNWGDEATDFAVQTSSALAKVGLSTGTTVDLPGTLDVTGNTTLDANLSVGGNASVTGTTSLTGNVTLTNNLTVNGNTQLGNANTDTIEVTGIVNVDSGVLYVDPTNNRVGINDTTPSEALDVTGNAAISGNSTIGGTLGVTGDVAINTNKFNITASSGNTIIAGTLGISNGTALAPAITPSGDTNTGLYSISADKIGFAANGVRQGEFGVGYGGFTGNVIQTTYVNNDTPTPTATSNTSNTNPTATGLKLSITPKYSNSKLLIQFRITNYTPSGQYIYIRIKNNTTNTFVGPDKLHSYNNTQGRSVYVANGFIYIDSPGTTSNEFEIYCYVSGSTGDININSYPNGMMITEIQQ